jgi:hypothetical protein
VDQYNDAFYGRVNLTLQISDNENVENYLKPVGRNVISSEVFALTTRRPSEIFTRVNIDEMNFFIEENSEIDRRKFFRRIILHELGHALMGKKHLPHGLMNIYADTNDCIDEATLEHFRKIRGYYIARTTCKDVVKLNIPLKIIDRVEFDDHDE